MDRTYGRVERAIDKIKVFFFSFSKFKIWLINVVTEGKILDLCWWNGNKSLLDLYEGNKAIPFLTKYLFSHNTGSKKELLWID